MKVYKIVNSCYNKYYSVLVGRDLSLVYKLHSETKSHPKALKKRYGIMAFDSYNIARVWLEAMDADTILECEANEEDVMKTRKIFLTPRDIYSYVLEGKTLKEIRSPRFYGYPPEETVFLKKLTPIKNLGR